MKSIKPEKLSRITAKEDNWDYDDWIDWFEAWKDEKENKEVTRLFEQQIELAVKDENDWYFNELIKLYHAHNPAGIYKYLPRISHFVFSNESKGDYAEDAVQMELALLYYSIDKHNWEINQFLQQLLYHSPDTRIREEVKKKAAELQVNDPGKIPLPIVANRVRYQLTLFVTESADTIELVRRNYNPLQADLIPAHVTLCRENELANLKDIERNLSLLYLPPVTVEFGTPKRFADDKGLLLPGTGPNTEYHELRKKLLKTTAEEYHPNEPHITLIHPRNGTCTDAIYQEVMKMQFPASITFDECCLVKQEGNNVWEIIRRFPLVK